ncbi:MAG: ATP-dependent DNA helicase RecG [Flavobacteriales bacterium]|nr:ATP-dependent DNA helicase RecG [Flavobacteriales bacterium]
MPSHLETEIEFLKGVGPVRGDVLRKELHIRTWADLLDYYPFRYIDRSQILRVADIVSDAAHVQLMGEIISLKESGEGKAKRLTGIFRDESGVMELVWFRSLRWLKSSLKLNMHYVLYGKPSEFKGKYNMVHPELELLANARITAGNPLKPVYNTSAKLTQVGLTGSSIGKLTLQLVDEVREQIPETLPPAIIEKFRLMNRADAYSQIHVPSGHEALEAARRRLKFEELFFIQVGLGKEKLMKTKHQRGVVFSKVGELFNDFYNRYLPFQLTGAQKRVMKEIRCDVGRGSHMNRLLQGDVGSGKTIVAVLTALLALDNGCQVCMMAPTEILAQQHLETVSTLLQHVNVKVALLTGAASRSERKIIHEELESGELKFLIGTHALIEPGVKFQNLGLAIIDEQHRFGVAQRAALWSKAAVPPHVLVMTATPIPRTLAMTVYGDLDVSVIDELPPGRKPIQTIHRTDASRLKIFQFMADEIKKGRQIYVVYPLIEESEKLDLKHLMDGYESMVRRFPLPDYRVSIVHGKMKPEDRNFEMQRFVKGETHIMVATTVIEVGVNVQNASVMVIESAERFGLSQLHQLRGRVGRGADQSHCILMTGLKMSSESKQRIATMCRTNDGFEIAEVDLQLRGPGDMMGTQQSGLVNLKIADLARDHQMLATAREVALEILEADPILSSEENKPIREELERRRMKSTDWSRIS